MGPRSLIWFLMPKRSSQTHIGRVGGGVVCVAGSVHWICYVAQQGALGGLTGVGFRQGLHKKVFGVSACLLKSSGLVAVRWQQRPGAHWQLACSAC